MPVPRKPVAKKTRRLSVRRAKVKKEALVVIKAHNVKADEKTIRRSKAKSNKLKRIREQALAAMRQNKPLVEMVAKKTSRKKPAQTKKRLKG
ncbi:MAG: hypothetical protein HQL23_08020 [Candidatus Omnitrophica bacterium]|nr:hypothetical protein [Candidatus Omnitrophota bacterium]